MCTVHWILPKPPPLRCDHFTDHKNGMYYFIGEIIPEVTKPRISYTTA